MSNRTPEEIEGEIDRIRARLDATLDELEHRLTPRELIRNGIGALSGFEASRYAVRLAGLVRRYPIPAAIAGISVAVFLIVAGQRRRSRLSDTAGSKPRIPQVRETAMEKLLDTRQKIAQSAVAARATLASAASNGKERASGIASNAGKQLRRASDKAQTIVREQPVAAGAVAALAIGAAAAMCIPSIRRKLH
jgi:ElaB/YqjD/DUF883 family membrane-anchored ribosome-binding protein